MPRLKKAMKDVAWRRYASGRCLATFDPEISEWGNPSEQTSETSTLDVVVHTQGSKTFQYLVEKKTKFISLVAASEEERAQTECRKTRGVVRW